MGDRLAKSGSDPRLNVHAAILTISFPRSLEAFLDSACIDYPSEWATDMERLVQRDVESRETAWTVPRWALVGDVMFFYHAATTQARLAHVRRELIQAVKATHSQNEEYSIYFYTDDGIEHVLSNAEPELHAILERAENLSSSYGGTLFGCGQIASPAEYKSNYSLHYRGRIFADINNLHFFETPLPLNKLRDAVKISQGAVTNLYGSEYTAVLKLLSADNVLPAYLEESARHRISLQQLGRENWPVLAADKAIRFAHESQLRVYLSDYLLNELKDPGTPLLQECRCIRNDIQTGYADYFLRLGGTWIPVEAKLNVAAEKDISAQVRQYSGVEFIFPTKGLRRDSPIETSKSPFCLVIDQVGIYIFLAGEFFGCSSRNPRWLREGLNHESVQAIRKELLTLLIETQHI